MQKPLSYQDFRSQISILELATHYDYTWKKEKGKTMPVLYNGEFDDRIVVKNPHDSANQLYFQVGSYSDRGTLINFVRERLPTVFSRFNDPRRSQAASINAVLNAYLDLELSIRQKNQSLIPISPAGSSNSGNEQRFHLDYYGLRPLPETNYLIRERGIHPELLRSTEFEGRISSQQIYFAQEGIKQILAPGQMPPPGVFVHENVVFPYYRPGHSAMTGLEIRNKGVKLHGGGSDRGHSVWISNFPENLKRVVISESAIDSISFRQLEVMNLVHAERDSLFTSVGGSITPEQIQALKGFVGAAKPTWVLAFDNDLAGTRQTLNALVMLSENGLHHTTTRRDKYLAIAMPKTLAKVTASHLQAYNESIKAEIQQETQPELKAELVAKLFYWKTSPAPGGWPVLEIPRSQLFIQLVNSALVRYAQFPGRVEILQPRLKDYNEDLKSENTKRRTFPLVVTLEGKCVYWSKSEKAARTYAEDHFKKSVDDPGVVQILRARPGQLAARLQGRLHREGALLLASYDPDFNAATNRQKHREVEIIR